MAVDPLPPSHPEDLAHCRRPEDVRAMFGHIAGCYDLFNHIFSFGVDYLWRWHLIRALERQVSQKTDTRLLDLATGSGDVALALQKRGWQVIGADFCLPLLEKAQIKGVKQLLQADAHQLPFTDQAFDAVTIAFGFRNFNDRDLALREIQRVLKPGGWLFILEFSQPYSWFRPFYLFHTRCLMPALAHLFQRCGFAYRYLNDTIEAFPDAGTLARQLENCAFAQVTWSRFSFGSVALHAGQKRQ